MVYTHSLHFLSAHSLFNLLSALVPPLDTTFWENIINDFWIFSSHTLHTPRLLNLWLFLSSWNYFLHYPFDTFPNFIQYLLIFLTIIPHIIHWNGFLLAMWILLFPTVLSSVFSINLYRLSLNFTWQYHFKYHLFANNSQTSLLITKMYIYILSCLFPWQCRIYIKVQIANMNHSY